MTAHGHYHAFFLSVISRDNFGYADSHVERHMLPRQLATVNGPADWREALDIIALGSPEQVVR